MNDKKIRLSKYFFAGLLLFTGLAFNIAKIGKDQFMGYNSVGNYLVFCGLLLFAIIILRSFKKGKALPDEREMFISSKANRLTFVFIMLIAFVIMIADGIKPIELKYSLFMGYFVCAILIFYFAAYRILLRYG
jgi:uncharacterized membrane protein